MFRCCDGDTYVAHNGHRKHVSSWAVLCLTCDRCLAVVDGPREEVYAEL